MQCAYAGDHLVIDIHGGASGATRTAAQFFAATQPGANSTAVGWGAINCETNCGEHATHRMLEEATDLNEFFSFPDTKLHGRAASFCMERSGYNEGGLNDQGISFFLPNMTWLQPPGWVHSMVAESFLPYALNVSLNCTTGQPPVVSSISVQRSSNRSRSRPSDTSVGGGVAPGEEEERLVIRAVGAAEGNLTVIIRHGAPNACTRASI
jgi:hypothetical protein